MTARPQTTRMAPWAFAKPWGARGYLSDLGGNSGGTGGTGGTGDTVHWIEFGDDIDGRVAAGSAPPIVFVHGLGGSHLNWTLIGPALARGRRTVALDLGGFGLTSGAGRDTSVQANAELLDRFVREIVGEPAILVGNSMGGMVSVLHAAVRPESVAGLVLVDPSLPVPRQRPDLQVSAQFLMYAIPGLGEQYMRRTYSRTSSRELVERVVRLCFADPTRADPQVIDAGIALAEQRQTMPDTERWFLRAARSLLRTLARPDGYRRMLAGIDAPVLLIHGEDDRLVPISAARDSAARSPAWQTAYLPGVGHTPQLEVPDRVIAAITDWISRHPSLAHG